MPHIRQNYEETVRAVEGADLVVSHPLTLSIPLLDEQKKVKWASAVLSPISFFSVHDPIEISGHAVMSSLTRGPMWLRKLIFAMGRAQTKGWIRPLLDFRRELGLSP